MQLSKYCNVYPYSEGSDDLILYSSKNAAIVQIPKSNFKSIARLTRADRNLLSGLGFLVADPEEERREMLGYIDELNQVNRSLGIKVVMGLDCNLACRYCFEGTRKGKFYMTRETADCLVDFIEGRIDRQALNEIHLVFYGGEPLLSKKLIIYIAEKVKALSRRRRIPFDFSLQTNGTLLTKKTAKELKPLGLTAAYITVDGEKENHNISRPYKSGGGSFDRIIGNIKDVCKIVDVQLSGNFTKGNFEQFPSFLDFLLHIGVTAKEIPFVRFFPVTSENADYAPPEFHDGCVSINEPWLFEADLFLKEEILKRGYRGERISPGVCMMEHNNNILVNYNGDIYKCPGLIGRQEYRVGDITKGIKDYKESHCIDNWKNDDCLACAYLPLCFGGCRYSKFIRDGNMDGVDCRKPYYDATLEALVKQDITYGLCTRK